jgi:hypothetical protein
MKSYNQEIWKLYKLKIKNTTKQKRHVINKIKKKKKKKLMTIIKNNKLKTCYNNKIQNVIMCDLHMHY